MYAESVRQNIRQLSEIKMKTYKIVWLVLSVSLLIVVLLFIAIYSWISMTSHLAVYATYAGVMQAVQDYQNGDLYLYVEEDVGNDAMIKIGENKFKPRLYSTSIFDIGEKYGMQHYVNAYNRKMSQLCSTAVEKRAKPTIE